MYKIRIENLDLFYNDFQALKNVNMEFKEKEITALIGPTGCGKTTLLKCVNRMHDFPEKCRITGDIKLDDVSIYGDTDVHSLRKRVGMIFPKPNPFPMSIYDNVAFGPRAHGIRSKTSLDRVVEEAMRKAGLWEECKDRLKKNALELPKGKQQRLCIARALAVEPEVLLMDEPASALDPASTLKIEELILELKKSHTIIIATHNMQQAVRIADTAAFILLGELIEINDADQLFSLPKDKRTENYITGRLG